MQNKANFKNDEMNVSSIFTKDYENKCPCRPDGKQSQTKPISRAPKSGNLGTRHGGWPVK